MKFRKYSAEYCSISIVFYTIKMYVTKVDVDKC